MISYLVYTKYIFVEAMKKKKISRFNSRKFKKIEKNIKSLIFYKISKYDN